MSTVSNRSSHGPQRRIQSSRSVGKPRQVPRSHTAVTREDAYSYALRVAFLHYLLQPKARRKQYVSSASKQTSSRPQSGLMHGSIGHLFAEFSSRSGSGPRLPSDIRKPLERRIEGVVRGTEKLPGYADPAVKRCFAEAYTTFTEKSFQKMIEKDRKVELVILKFYTAAIKAAQKGSTDDSWKLLGDRHTALFARLVTALIRDMGQDRDKELMSLLAHIEKRLLADEEIAPENAGPTAIEVAVPLSYQVKDMPLVLTAARIFGVSTAAAQQDVDAAKTTWTEEAAVRDLKIYQHRLSSDMTGALRSEDFDLEETWHEWKKSETHFLTQMIVDIFSAKPELKRAPGPSGLDLPTGTARPQSMFYGEDQAYADLGRAVLSDDYSGLPSDQGLNFNALSLEQPSTIRSVDEPNYTFTPPDPRSFYKAVLHHAAVHDRSAQADPQAQWEPLAPASVELLTELSVRWRVPQSSRLVTFVEVVARKYADGHISGEELDTALELAKSPPPEPKRAPYILNHSKSLQTLPPAHWTSEDVVDYAQTLHTLHHSLLRDLHALMMKCYSGNPALGVVMHNLQNHVRGDPLFVQSAEDDDWFANELAAGLQQHAQEVYRHSYIDQILPSNTDEWNFLHVVQLGKAVVKLYEKIKKRYRQNPVVMGVSPLAVLVETMFPNFEDDARAIVERTVQASQESGVEVHVQDGFDLYRELTAIRRIHHAALPQRPFGFNLEELLVGFVRRFVADAEATLDTRIEEAIKLDPFQVRNQDADAVPTDADRHSSSIIDVFMLYNATVAQVNQLRWENDVHCAKFMTALSKSFAAGIARYCELVEAKFVKEMDRPTAQEIAAATQKTAQERFLQYAKDAWTTKEKLEPFQFYPESFVKLNNVEYAMQELEKLETAMNVEENAKLLARVEPPKSRRPTNFVFTVKIVEAEDLRACDPSGKSDPYVILGDEFKKRLYKTRIMYRTLNPRWDESVDIASKGAVNLIVTIWDWDTFGEHDCVGRTSLKLDPVHFGDFLPREFWLDLDSQGRVLLRVSMEGEQDGIEFYFGKAFRHLKRTERDMVRKITDKLSAQINLALSRDTLRGILKTGGIGMTVTNLWKKAPTSTPTTGPGEAEIEQAIMPLCNYFNENFAIMNQTLARATMDAVMARLWKEVLMAIEGLVVPPLSEKPSSQKPLGQRELDIVYTWLNQLFEFFNAKDQSGEQLGVQMGVLKSPKYLELFSLNFFYFDDTQSLIRESERIATAAAQRAQQSCVQAPSLASHRISAPPSMLSPLSAAGGGGGGLGAGAPFASMGTIRRGKSLMISRNLGTMRRVKAQKRRDAQAEPTDDMILRILRMRPEAAGYLRERFRQKERQAATSAAARIVMNSVNQGWNSSPAGMGGFNRNSMMPRR